MERASSHSPSGFLAPVALAAGLGAVIASSCCVLPLTFGGLGAGASVFAVLAWLADYRTPMLVISAALVVTAWALYFRRHGARRTAAALVLASILVAMAASWPWIETPLLKIVRAHR